MLTAGRHLYANRSLSCFLDQDYTSKHLLIYQNSDVYKKLDPSIDSKLVTLINCHIDSQTGKPYDNLGAIYNDAIQFIPKDADVINIYDDDDMRLPFFISESMLGYERALSQKKLAFKPHTSFYRNNLTIYKTSNSLESSIFVNTEHLLTHKFHPVNVCLHHKWVDALIMQDLILEDDENKPAYCYCWSEEVDVYKTSAHSETDTFKNFRILNTDHGDNVFKRLNPFYLNYLYRQILESKVEI